MVDPVMCEIIDENGLARQLVEQTSARAESHCYRQPCSATARRTWAWPPNNQRLLLLGSSFTAVDYLQVVRGHDATQTGVIFTAATAGILGLSLAAERLAHWTPAADDRSRSCERSRARRNCELDEQDRHHPSHPACEAQTIKKRRAQPSRELLS
jgi:hypothetical protein